MITTRLQLERRLRELLTGLSKDERERVITEVAGRYQLPSVKRSRWRLVDGVELAEQPPCPCSTVERGDGSEEIYSSSAPGHANRARAIVSALNQIEGENLAPSTS